MNSFGGGALCLIVLSGLVLWWRGTRKWMHGLVFRLTGSINSITWNLHNAVGIWMAPILFVWGFSAIYFGYRTEFEKVVGAVLP
ncbi:PepSY-associated TM helix domain-containing protein, partial [Acinetobacter baumannii]